MKLFGTRNFLILLLILLPALVPAQAGQWRKLIEFHGPEFRKSTTITQVFSVPSKVWRITWVFDRSKTVPYVSLYFFVYRPGNTFNYITYFDCTNSLESQRIISGYDGMFYMSIGSTYTLWAIYIDYLS